MRKLYIIVISVLAFLLVPAITQATNDENITSIGVVNITDTTPNTSTSFSATVTFANTSIDTLYLLMQEQPSGNPSESGFGWENVTFGPAVGISGQGVPYTSGSMVVGYMIDVTSNSTSASLGFNNLGITATDGCYALLMTTSEPAQDTDFTVSDPFEVGSGDCDSVAEDAPSELSNVAGVGFGSNLGFVWDAYDDENLAGYSIMYSTDESELSAGDATMTAPITGTSTVISDLDKNTTYYYVVEAQDADGARLAASATSSVATENKDIPKQKFSKLKKKKVKKQTFVINWQRWKDSLSANEIDFIDKVTLEIRSKKNGKAKTLVKKYKNLSPTKNKIKVTKKFTEPKAKYYARAQATYSTAETTKWSNWIKVTLQ